MLTLAVKVAFGIVVSLDSSLWKFAQIVDLGSVQSFGHLKDSIMPRYAELIYNGFWFSPEREMLQALIDKSQEHVTGTVRLKLYKGSADCVGRWSDYSLYSEAHVTFEDDAGAYDQADAKGFIQLNALRLKLLAARDRRVRG